MFTEEFKIWTQWMYCWVVGGGSVMLAIVLPIMFWNLRKQMTLPLAVILIAAILNSITCIWYFIPFSPGFAPIIN